MLLPGGWGVEGNLGLGFKYKAYGGKVNMGPFTFKKNEAKDMGGLTILEVILEVACVFVCKLFLCINC